MEAAMLQPLNWMDILEVGVVEIDADHRNLLQECNDMMAMWQANADWRAVVASAGCMVEHCVNHFRLEEKLLAQAEFPRLESHVREHTHIAGKLA